ncbi:MAG TPA: hypothetical protein VMA72_01860 [Streptosporangiaceae bacterium]|nr:hypothetical protein [Streptosporangiaceae bacterium]
MPPLQDQDPRSGRHAAGHHQSRHKARRHWARAARFGLFVGMFLTLARLISWLLFHRDIFGGDGFGGFVTDVVSLVLAGVGLALIACVAGALWKRARRRLGGPPGRAADA